MKRILERIEEFNLGREKRFKGQIEDTTLYVIHDLDAALLDKSITALKSITKFKNIQVLHFDNLDTVDKNQSMIVTLHLALDTEIPHHNRISNWAFDHGVFQLNPYNKLAKIFDDKYLFYVLMMANAVRQPFTVSLPKGSREISEIDKQALSRFKKVVLKPRNGTEKIDFMIVDDLDSSEAQDRITKIHGYDGCLVQEFIDFQSEFKVLYLQGKFYAKQPIVGVLRDFLYNVVEIIDDYAVSNQIIMPELFSLDILETSDQSYMILEANIRPAGIFKLV